jgi:hypothetical protein
MESLDVVVFQYGTLLKSAIEAINELSQVELYRIFNRYNDSKLLTSALLKLYEIESQTFNSLISGNYPSWSSQCKNMTDIYNALDIDYQLLNSNRMTIYPYVFVATINGIYSGHLYAWTIDLGNYNVTNITGIRSGIYNFFCDPNKRIEMSLISQVYEWLKPKQTKKHYIRILQPTNELINNLINVGFISSEHFNPDNKNLLSNNVSLGNIIFTKKLILREKDYIFDLDKKLSL